MKSNLHQGGVVLYDAMIATILVLVLGAGPLYVASKASVAQKADGLQQVASSQLRSILMTTPRSSICDDDGLVGDWAQAQTMSVTAEGNSATSIDLVVTAQCANQNVVIGGVTVSKPMVTLIACLPASTGVSGPVILQEGQATGGEPTTCEK